MLFNLKAVTFVLFFILGFCGLLYEIVWLRQALLAYGAIAPMVSVVISAFMFGTALGSWLGGRWVLALCARTKSSPMTLMAVGSLLVAISSFSVPFFFSLGETLLLPLGPIDSFSYMLASTVLLAATIVPWTFFMGASFPTMIVFLRAEGSQKSLGFRHLYVANILGSMCGAFLTPYVLIELNGLRGTLFVAARLNIVAALIALLVSRYYGHLAPLDANALPARNRTMHRLRLPPGLILFVIGFCSFATQVVWTRLYSPLLGNTTYGFAFLLLNCMFGTWLGSGYYLHEQTAGREGSIIKPLAALAAFSVLAPVLGPSGLSLGVLSLTLAVVPYFAALGYLTPLLIEQRQPRPKHGRIERIGRAYGLNILGCIAGPLVASYFLLPSMSEKAALAILALPFIVLTVFQGSWRTAVAVTVFVVCSNLMAGHSEPQGIVRRDHTATVMVNGSGMTKNLYVNAVKVATLRPTSKMMAHLPLALHHGPVESVLVIGFGTGTTFRSALSWGAKTTAVELVPSVRDMFGFFHADAADVLKNPDAQIIIDDARRFLKRSDTKYDVIIVDPSPPLECAASAMLYSREFYQLAQEHLAPGGILHLWYSIGETRILQAIVKSLLDSFQPPGKFRNVLAFRSADRTGVHFVASLGPIELPRPDAIADWLPPSAANDLREWTPDMSARELYHEVFGRPLRPTALISENASVVITDDHPFNEFYQVRRAGWLQFE